MIYDIFKKIIDEEILKCEWRMKEISLLALLQIHCM